MVPRTNRILHVLHWILSLLSFLCIVASLCLCILFPAVELPPIEGPYNVGKVDLFLPLAKTGGHVWVRLLYPTLDTPLKLPYLTPETAVEYCFHSMKFGAPHPLNQFGWILHTWRLTERWERDGAALLDTVSKLPVVVYSHGLGGHADVYSYQTHTLAAQGNVVLTLTHTDGSSPVLQYPDGAKREYDYGPQQLEKEHGYTMQVIQMRRNQNEIRVQEVLAATKAIHRWNKEDIPTDVSGTVHLSLKGRLDLERTIFMGHSFGAASVLTAAHRHPELVHTVIAHEPALDWSHPSTVASLFAQSRIANLTKASLYRRDRFGDPSPDDDSVHHSANVFFLFSHEWFKKGWAMIPLLLEMQEASRLGGHQTMIRVDYVEDAHHNEFSDTGKCKQEMSTDIFRIIRLTLFPSTLPVQLCSHQPGSDAPLV